jgi:hypothetical protein
MSFVHDYTPTTLLGTMYPGIILELKNPANYPPGTSPKRYYDARSLLELSSPTTQCNRTVGKLTHKMKCWICGAPIFLEQNGTPTFSSADTSEPTISEKTRNGRLLNAECEHILPVLAAWWVIGSLATGNEALTGINTELHKYEYKWSHHYCNHYKLDTLYFTPDGEINRDVLRKTLNNIWHTVKPIRNYYQRNGVTKISDFYAVQIPKMEAVLAPLVGVYKTMIGEEAGMHTLAAFANINSHLMRLAESDSIPPNLKLIVSKGIGFREPPALKLTPEQERMRGMLHTDTKVLTEEDAQSLAGSVIENLPTVRYNLNCNPKSAFTKLFTDIYDNKKSKRDPSYLAFMYNVLGFTQGEVISRDSISSKLCILMSNYILKITPLVLRIVNSSPRMTNLQRQASFLERLQISLYNNLIEKIRDSTIDIENVSDAQDASENELANDILEYLSEGMLSIMRIVEERVKMAQ